MNENVIVKESSINNKGVFATRDFKKGEVVLPWQTNTILTMEEVKKLPASERNYIANYAGGKYLHQQEPERYVNHSCDPNTETGDDCDVAIRDIKSGEEITSDYSKAKFNMHFVCNCGSKNCRKYI
ncbi:MAG: SET domain-containing protein-lysine N-methyltransferase [Patescibacteria group bacterium]|jgi:SET domain-containing protein